jgi:steroid delta-isomerase-like uncharacterized protein
VVRKEVNKMMEIFQKHLTSFGAGDWETYKADLAPDLEYEDLATGKRYKGVDEVFAAVLKWKTAFPDLKPSVKRSYELGDTFVGEMEWAGTHKGALETPLGTIPASNKSVRLTGITIYRVKDGKFVEIRTFLDLLGALRQIGAMPALASEAKPGAEKRVVH